MSMIIKMYLQYSHFCENFYSQSEKEKGTLLQISPIFKDFKIMVLKYFFKFKSFVNLNIKNRFFENIFPR